MNDDILKKLDEAKTLLLLVKDAKADEIRTQHLNRLERILVLIESSLRSDG